MIRDNIKSAYIEYRGLINMLFLLFVSSLLNFIFVHNWVLDGLLWNTSFLGLTFLICELTKREENI